MIKVTKSTVKQTRRADRILLLRQRYEGDLHASRPAVYNKVFADVLRQMADAVEKTRGAFADPEVVVWMHVDGEITAQVMLSPEK